MGTLSSGCYVLAAQQQLFVTKTVATVTTTEVRIKSLSRRLPASAPPTDAWASARTTHQLHVSKCECVSKYVNTQASKPNK